MARLTPDEVSLARVRRWREVRESARPDQRRHTFDEKGRHTEDCARCAELARYVQHGGPRPEGVQPRRTTG